VRDGGQDPMAALESATSISAQSMNMGDKIGALAQGLEADIVGFDGDPLKDVNAARKAVFVMKGGKIYENLRPGSK
jgi:imidazolonepropionase-like amidohydrolase